jgi:hypothetical protein
MKNPVTILLLTVHLMAYSDIAQVFRFPNLIQHYKVHHSNNSSVGFIDFLLMHYGKHDDGNPKDDKEDMSLPFKTIDLHLFGQAVVVPQLPVISEVYTITYNNFYFSYYTGIIHSTHKTILFRPPIFAV